MKRSNFMILPREIRDAIYELALMPQNSEAGVFGGRTIVVSRDESTAQWVRQPALTKVSKTIREETLPMFYGMNSFIIRVQNSPEIPPNQVFNRMSLTLMRKTPGPFDFAGAQHWLQQIGTHNIRLIKHLEIRLLTEVEIVKHHKPSYQRKLNEYLMNWGIVLPRSTTFLAVANGTTKRSWEPVAFSYITTDQSPIFQALARRGVSKDIHGRSDDMLEAWQPSNRPIPLWALRCGDDEVVGIGYR